MERVCACERYHARGAEMAGDGKLLEQWVERSQSESNAEEREALEPLRAESELLRQHTGTERPARLLTPSQTQPKFKPFP